MPVRHEEVQSTAPILRGNVNCLTIQILFRKCDPLICLSKHRIDDGSSSCTVRDTEKDNKYFSENTDHNKLNITRLLCNALVFSDTHLIPKIHTVSTALEKQTPDDCNLCNELILKGMLKNYQNDTHIGQCSPTTFLVFFSQNIFVISSTEVREAINSPDKGFSW